MEKYPWTRSWDPCGERNEERKFSDTAYWTWRWRCDGITFSSTQDCHTTLASTPHWLLFYHTFNTHDPVKLQHRNKPLLNCITISLETLISPSACAQMPYHQNSYPISRCMLGLLSINGVAIATDKSLAIIATKWLLPPDRWHVAPQTDYWHRLHIVATKCYHWPVYLQDNDRHDLESTRNRSCIKRVNIRLSHQ